MGLSLAIIGTGPNLFMSSFCYNFLCYVTLSPMFDHVEWSVQLLKLQLAYFVLGVTLMADSGPGFNTCVSVSLVRDL
jgi:hypothetical protein